MNKNTIVRMGQAKVVAFFNNRKQSLPKVKIYCALILESCEDENTNKSKYRSFGCTELL